MSGTTSSILRALPRSAGTSTNGDLCPDCVTCLELRLSKSLSSEAAVAELARQQMIQGRDYYRGLNIIVTYTILIWGVPY